MATTGSTTELNTEPITAGVITDIDESTFRDASSKGALIRSSRIP